MVSEKRFKKLVERVESLEKEKEELKQENQKLKKHVKSGKQMQEQSKIDTENSSGVSRRGFLKGLGALGVGALAMSSPVASKMTVTSDTIEKDGADIWQGGLFNTNDYLQLSGNNVMTGDLDLGGNSLDSVKIINFSDRGGDGNAWRIFEAENDGRFLWQNPSATIRMQLSDVGDLKIDGNLTENASI